MLETRIKIMMATYSNGSWETATISQMGWKVMNHEAVVEVVVVGMEVAAELVVVVVDTEAEEVDTEAEEVDMEAEDMEEGVEDVEVVD